MQSRKNNSKRIAAKQMPRITIRKDLGSHRSKKSVGMICFPEKVDVAVCTKRGTEVKAEPPKKCYCIRCEKRSADGSCYCSHCLGIFDKSVAIRPSNKEIATQCRCYESNNIITDVKSKNYNTENEKLFVPETHNQYNYPNISQKEYNSNTSGNEKEQKKQVLYTNVKLEPDKTNEYNKSQLKTFPLNNSKSEDKNDIKLFSLEEEKKPMYINIKNEPDSEEDISYKNIKKEEYEED